MRWVFKLWWGLIRFGFRLLYNELAFTYDYVSQFVSLGAWRCWQRSVITHLQSGQFVLELAHGTGDLQIDLKNQGYRTVGYDLSANMGKIARRKLLKQGKDAVLVRGMAQTLPFPDKSFDAVVSTFPTTFIFEKQTLQDIHRILVDDGVLVIVPSGLFTGGGILRRFLEWLYRITGQHAGDTVEMADTLMWQVFRVFEDQGFTTELHHQNCPRSVAQIITCRKKV